VSKMICKVRSLKSRIKTCTLLEEITTWSNKVLKDFDCEMAVGIRTLGNPTQKTAESHNTGKQSASSQMLTLQLQVTKSDL